MSTLKQYKIILKNKRLIKNVVERFKVPGGLGHKKINSKLTPLKTTRAKKFKNFSIQLGKENYLKY